MRSRASCGGWRPSWSGSRELCPGARLRLMASSQQTQKSLPLILARELAANTATPFMVVDPVGTMVFYNEAAERILGQSFAASGELPADKWRGAIAPKNPDGS